MNSLPVFGGAVGALSGSVPGLAAGEFDVDGGVGDGVAERVGGSAVGTAGGTGTGTGAGAPPPLAATIPIPITTATPSRIATTTVLLCFGRKSRFSIDALAGKAAGKGAGIEDGSEGTRFGGRGARDCCGMTPGGAGAVGADDAARGNPWPGNTECTGAAVCAGKAPG